MPHVFPGPRLGRAILVAAALGLALHAPRVASAQEPQAPPAEDLRARARALGDEGLAAFAAGDHATALARFDEAELLVPVPTLGLRAARSLERLGRWVEAVERFQRTARMPIDPALPDAYRVAQAAAQREAVAEGEALAARMPTVRIAIEGDPAESVSMDGRALPLDRLGEARRVDPGEHVLVARRASVEVLARVVLVEGAAETVVLQWPAAAPASAPPRDGPDPRRATVVEPSGWSTQETVGWIGVSSGALGISVGLVTLVLAQERRADLDVVCVDGICRQSVAGAGVEEDVDAYNTLATTSAVTLLAGAGLVSLGAVLVLTAPETPPAAARLRPLLVAGPRGDGDLGAIGGVRGSFD